MKLFYFDVYVQTTMDELGVGPKAHGTVRRQLAQTN
jgi:hypothetical protein